MSSNPNTAGSGEQSAGMQGLTAAEKAAAPQDNSFRLDSLSAQSAGESPAPPTRRGLPMQGVFFVVMVLAVGATLVVMRQLGLGPAISFAGTKSDYTPSGRKSDHDKILKDLSNFQVEAQVPADQVQKNPFRMADSITTKSDAPVITGDPEADERARLEAERRAAEQRMAEVQGKLASIEIHTILAGTNPVARVNDQTVRVGDTLDDVFVVKAIHARSIELEFEGHAYTVSMDDKSGGDKKASGPAAPKGAKRK